MNTNVELPKEEMHSIWLDIMRKLYRETREPIAPKANQDLAENTMYDECSTAWNFLENFEKNGSNKAAVEPIKTDEK